MPSPKSPHFLLILALAISAFALNSCLKSDSSGLPSPDTAASTGICGTTWVLDSVGSRPATAEQYESYIFNLDGTGTHVGYDTSSQSRLTTKFSWASYYGYLITVKFEGSGYAGNLYYRLMKNGYLRCNGTDVAYYIFKPQ